MCQPIDSSKDSFPILNERDKYFTNYGTTYRNNLTQNDNYQTKLNYPKAVIFVLCSKFFESFSANGVRTILALYLRDELNYTEEFSTSFLHVFNFFSQFCPIFGAVIADSYLGNSKTIFYLCFLYGTGWIGMVTITFPLKVISFKPLMFTSLILIAIGNGNIRACIASLGGTQFKLPDQNEALVQYFSNYYFLYTMGILFSKVIPPTIRAETQCFGKPDCYPAVFGTLAGMFLICWIVFMFGMFFYKPERPSDGNVFYKVIGCATYGAVRKLREKPRTTSPWIEKSIGRYSELFVNDVSIFLKVLKLFIPLPIYWALQSQQDSTWTFQASQLNTRIMSIQIEADQAKAMGPMLLLILIPIWKQVITPCLHKIGYSITPLQSITIGGICATMSFICAAVLQLQIERTTEHQISILWQIPQFFLLMMGEVLLAIPGLQFAFTQAPLSMKSVLTAAWFLNSAIGNLIVIIITEIQPIKLQSNEYFLYAALMLVAIIIFTIIASHYKCLKPQDLPQVPNQPETYFKLQDGKQRYSSENLM